MWDQNRWLLEQQWNWKTECKSWYWNSNIGIKLYSEGASVTLQSEMACLVWDHFHLKVEDPDLINAGKQTITELPQTAYFECDFFE